MCAQSLALPRLMTSGYGQLTFTLGDIRDIQLNKSFDAVIALFHVISYQATNEDVTATFETANENRVDVNYHIFVPILLPKMSPN